MSGGLEWAAEQEESESQYREHIKSGKFSKKYLEQDIVAALTTAETRLLVNRLIIHRLGGWSDFLKGEYGGFSSYFDALGKKQQEKFLIFAANKLNLEFAPTKKLDKLRKKLGEIEAIMHPRSEEGD